MTKVLMFTSCRCDSERVPNKVVLELGGKPAFVQILERALEGCPNPDHVALVTPQQMVNDPAAMLARLHGYDVVRNLRDSANEQLRAFDEYGLDDDDIYIPLSGDSPLQYTKHLAFAVEKMQEYDAELALPILHRGTLGWAAHAGGPIRVGHYRRIVPRHTIWARGCGYGSLRHHGRHLLIEMPAYLQTPWPWATLHVDWPLQAVVMKHLYGELYDGKPIDLRDVHEEFCRDPMMANLVPSDAPVADQPSYPQGSADIRIDAVKANCDYVEVKFEEGGDEKKTD